MWTPGEQALTMWVEWLCSGTFLEDLGISQAIDGFRTLRYAYRSILFCLHVKKALTASLTSSPSVPDPRLLPLLLTHDTQHKRAKFAELSFTCEVCMSSCKGSRCLRLSCSHVFCRSCLDGFWKVGVAEGDLTRVGCPDPKCVKDRTEAREEEVRAVVEKDVFERWKYLHDKRAFDSGTNGGRCFSSTCSECPSFRREARLLSHAILSGSGSLCTKH